MLYKLVAQTLHVSIVHQRQMLCGTSPKGIENFNMVYNVLLQHIHSPL